MTNSTKNTSMGPLPDLSYDLPELEDTGPIGCRGKSTCQGCDTIITTSGGILCSMKWCTSCYTILDEKMKQITDRYGAKKPGKEGF